MLRTGKRSEKRSQLLHRPQRQSAYHHTIGKFNWPVMQNSRQNRLVSRLWDELRKEVRSDECRVGDGALRDRCPFQRRNARMPTYRPGELGWATSPGYSISRRTKDASTQGRSSAGWIETCRRGRRAAVSATARCGRGHCDTVSIITRAVGTACGNRQGARLNILPRSDADALIPTQANVLVRRC